MTEALYEYSSSVRSLLLEEAGSEELRNPPFCGPARRAPKSRAIGLNFADPEKRLALVRENRTETREFCFCSSHRDTASNSAAAHRVKSCGSSRYKDSAED
jgi:hypothetical protein